MAPSIWTVDERLLLAKYLAQYRASDEESRILLLENKVIPNFLAAFPPGQPDSDEDEPIHDRLDLREAERRLKQKIHAWFIKKTPLNVSSTPRRKPRARGDSEVREVLKHYVEIYRVGTEQSRKILIATRVLPEFVRQFLPYGDVSKLSKEKRSYYRNQVRDWLTLEAYYRDEGEQDPEHGLRLTLDAVSGSDSSDWPPHSPTPSVRRKRATPQDDLPTAKRQKTSTNTDTREPPSSSPSREVRSSSAETSRRLAPRSPTPSYESSSSLRSLPPPSSTVYSSQTHRSNARYVVYSAPPSPEPEESPEPEPEVVQDPSTPRRSARYIVYSATPSPEPEDSSDFYEVQNEGEAGAGSDHDQEDDLEDELEYPELEPEVGADLRSESPVHVQNYNSTPSPRQRMTQDLEDQDREGVVLQEPGEDMGMQDEEDSSHEEGLLEREKELQEELQGLREEAMAQEQGGDQDNDSEVEEGESQQQSQHTPSKRPVAAAPPINPAESQDDGLPSSKDAPSARSLQLPADWSFEQSITVLPSPSLEDILEDAIAPLLGQHSSTAIVRALKHVLFGARSTSTPARVTQDEDARDEDNGHDQEHPTAACTATRNRTRQGNRGSSRNRPTLESRLAQRDEDRTSLEDNHNVLTSFYQATLTRLDKLQAMSEASASQTTLLAKRFKDLYEVLTDAKGRKSKNKTKPRKSKDSTTTVAGTTGASVEALADARGHKSKSKPTKSKDSTSTGASATGATSSTSRRQPAVEAIVGRFRKAIGAHVTVTYYLVKLVGRPLKEATWRSLEDFAQVPNAAIILAEFHAQAEAEGHNLSRSKDDYVYLRAAFLAGWDGDGTVHERT